LFSFVHLFWIYVPISFSALVNFVLYRIRANSLLRVSTKSYARTFIGWDYPHTFQPQTCLVHNVTLMDES